MKPMQFRNGKDAPTAIVTGGAGFLGSYVCERLLAEGTQVICVDNLMTGRLANVAHLRSSSRFTLIEADIVATLPDIKVDEIWNLACPASPPSYQADPIHTLLTNVLGTKHCLDLGVKSGARVFQASTSEVYGDPEIHPQVETYRGYVNSTGPRACYDEGKRAAETLCFDYKRTYGVDIRVARIFNTYGPRMNPKDGRVVSNFIVQALLGNSVEIYGDGRQTRSFCFVTDLIEGLFRLMRLPTEVTEPVNIGNPDEFTMQELASLVLELTRSASSVSVMPLPIDDPKKRCPDISLAEKLLDWRPTVSLKEGLGATIEYFCNELWLAPVAAADGGLDRHRKSPDEPPHSPGDGTDDGQCGRGAARIRCTLDNPQPFPMSEYPSGSSLDPRWPQKEAQAEQPFLVPLISGRTRAYYALLAALWVACLLVFWAWRLHPNQTVDVFKFVVNCAFLFWTTAIPGLFIAIVWRACVPHPARPVPKGLRVAMVVTKAPSEPFEIVEKTLRGMLNQTYPHDTWLADEDPSAETVAWCARHDVRVSTRKGVAAYHNASWPRRTKCKEGNLAYFYDQYGYEGYDFVSQLDADHVPTATYLEEMLRPFADKQVGYVSAPSICDSNGASSWSARGRLYDEGPFHGTLQAGYSGGLAPLCIGSHYAVRTAALRDIGGLGPELAEDHATTLMMNAKGWRGVHALNAIAHGEGPRTFADMATQEYQWSRSLMLILLRYTRHYYVPLPLRLKAQFLFCQLWYALFSLSMAASVVIPAVALWTHKVWANVDYGSYLMHAFPIMISLAVLMVLLRKTGSFRPCNTKLLSWEGVIFLFARWPWDLFGTLSAISDSIRGREFSFRVTPKGNVTEKHVPLRVVMPYLLISLFCGTPVLLVSHAKVAGGFYLFSIMSCLTYLLIAIVIVVAHDRERGSAPPGSDC